MTNKQPKKANQNTIKKGEVRNPKGRPKGVPNKRTTAQREAFETVMELIEKRMTNGDDVINNLSPARAAELYNNLLSYKKPKLSATKNESDIKQDVQINVNFKPFNNRFTSPDSDPANEGKDIEDGK